MLGHAGWRYAGWSMQAGARTLVVRGASTAAEMSSPCESRRCRTSGLKNFPSSLAVSMTCG